MLCAFPRQNDPSNVSEAQERRSNVESQRVRHSNRRETNNLTAWSRLWRLYCLWIKISPNLVMPTERSSDKRRVHVLKSYHHELVEARGVVTEVARIYAHAT